jgi:predicted metal-dependent peptidase
MPIQVSKLDKAKAQIVLDHPFFASILLRHPLIEARWQPTLAVTPDATIYYNPDFLEKLTVPQIQWALCHEVGHVIMMHGIRRRSRDRVKWNLAGDAVINDMLKQCGVGEPIPKCVEMDGSYEKTTDQVYNELPEDLSKCFGKGDDGEGQPDGNSGIGNDVLEGQGEGGGEPLTESEIKEAEARIKIEMAEAAQAAKMRGKLPGALAKFVADFIESKIPWFEHLERYMTALVAQGYSWARPNRRFMDHYLPSVGKLPQMGPVVIQIDVSGSISKRELDHYNGHMKRIVEQCRPEKIHVIYTDTQVQRHDVFAPDDDFGLEFFSGGGTDMGAGFRWCEKEGIEPECFITLTDGYTPFPKAADYDWGSIWCVSTAAEFPITAGDLIRFEAE